MQAPGGIQIHEHNYKGIHEKNQDELIKKKKKNKTTNNKLIKPNAATINSSHSQITQQEVHDLLKVDSNKINQTAKVKRTHQNLSTQLVQLTALT
jgi:SLT domain-containing protein